MAVFSEAIENPSRILDKYELRYNSSDLVVKPFVTFEQIEHCYLGHYRIGYTMVLQLFLATIHKEDDILDPAKVAHDLRTNRDSAAGFINILRSINGKRFFEYYMERVKRQIFIGSAREKLLEMINRQPASPSR